MSFSRSLLAFAMGLLSWSTAGCIGGQADKATTFNAPSPAGDDNNDGAFAPRCSTPDDCVLAASNCCDCPTFALPASDGFSDSCEEVDCEGPAGVCPALEASCDEQQECVAICSPVIATRICAFGFVTDAAGCLMDACDQPNGIGAPSCEFDSECEQVPSDCCGCAQGGSDIAVLVGQQPPLVCDENPACPGVNVCNADEVPRCIEGTCTLGVSMSPTPPIGSESTSFCGTPEYPPCAEALACVLNSITAKETGIIGVGLCIAI